MQIAYIISIMLLNVILFAILGILNNLSKATQQIADKLEKLS